MIDHNQKPIVEKPPELQPGVTQPVFFDQIVGLFATVSIAPTLAPKNIFQQIQIYKNGSTLRLYVWDNANTSWQYATLT